MKKSISGEKIALILVFLIIIATLFFLIYNLFTSNYSLTNNKSNANLTQNQTTNNNSSSSQNNVATDEIDKLNVDQDTINQKEDELSTTQPTQIATYTTTIYDSDTNRIDNISLAISKLNGTIVKKGEEFSFNSTIGPMDESQGFKKALGFDGQGNKIEISGGGICQISSTLYNSALLANLEVTERHPHSHRVYYVPQDKDATILYGTYDFKFKNNTDQDIKIEAINDTANVTINLFKI
jgi:vancomycin resistance protein YoaR